VRLRFSRLSAAAAAAAFVASAALLASSARAAGPARVAEIGMTVGDLDRSVAFYEDVLGFVKSAEVVELEGDAYERLRGVFPLRMRVARLRLGAEQIELTDYLAPSSRAFPADSRGNDRWFQHIAVVVSDMDRAYEVLRRHGVEHASSGPQTLPHSNPKAGGIRAFYFRDPDGHFLELIEFPRGKGDARWQSNEHLFLGIDHTAIVVADTEASLRFYRDGLGLTVAGGSENSGIEQERLNAVRGARLRITTLRAPRGPGIELLEYLAPRDGRAATADATASDLAHWQTRIATADIESATRSALRNGGATVSPGSIALDDRRLGFARAALVLDPDGHGVEIVEEPVAR
jgi:catechol 2,3-dioxygenase-like lactoylglutathione lyase family enzyme